MAIQIRRGASTDFDASKMVAGELGVSTDGSHKLWATGQAGDSWELANKEDLDDEVEAREALAETVEAQGESLETKAEVDGTYVDMVVGDVVSDKKIVDTVPYLFRPSASVGERAYETIVGASVGWNQLIQNGNFADGTTGWSPYNDANVSIAAANGVLTASFLTSSETASYVYGVKQSLANKIITNHKYAISFTLSATKTGAYAVDVNGNALGKQINVTTANVWTQSMILFNAVENNSSTFIIEPFRLQITTSDTMKIKDVMFIDLTALLGSTIADYVYSLETATAGSGIAKLREWGFCTGYAEYNAGSIESVEVTDKVVRGFNQWDEEWEVGGYADATGNSWNTSDRIRSKTADYIAVIPNMDYYFRGTSSFDVYWYDADKAYIGHNAYTDNTVHTSPNNAWYMRFATYANYGTTYNNDICINLSSSRNGEYEPYTSQSYPLGSDVLRGIFKLDANNNLYADGDVKSADGTIIRKYGIVDLGTLTPILVNWNADSTGVGWLYSFADIPSKATISASYSNAICTKYQVARYYELLGKIKEGISFYTANNYGLCVWQHDISLTTESAIRTAMSGVYLVYEKATETTEQSTPFTSPQVVYPDGTEEFVTTNSVPVGHSTDYPYSIKALAEELIGIPDVPSANGTYVLKATRSASGITYAWVTDSAVSSLASPLMSSSPQTQESDESDESEEEGETR